MDLKLQVLLAGIDRMTAPLRAITNGSRTAAAALKGTRDRLRELESAQKKLGEFRSLRKGLADTRVQLEAAQAKTAKLGKELAATANPSKKAAAEFKAAQRELAKLEQAERAQTVGLQKVRVELSGAGVNTKNLSAHERSLRADIERTNQAMKQQGAALDAAGQRERKLANARSQMQRTQGLAANMTVSGYGALEGGKVILEQLEPAIAEAKAWQTQVAQLRSQGVGDAMVADASKFAQGMDVMGNSATDNLRLLKEVNTVLRDMHEAEQVTPYLARMRFGIEAIMAQGGHGEGHGEQAESMFMDLIKTAELRGAAKDPEKLKRVLDFATQAYVASGGLVKPEDLLNMIKTGGVAAKQLDDKTFFFGLLHTMQEMGGFRAGTGLATAYQNWAAGRTTQQSAEELMKLGLLDKGSVKYGKTGHITKVLPGALKDSALYQSNPFEFLMTKVIPKINPTGKLTDMQVVSKINTLFSGRKGGDLFASLFMERANIAKHLAAAPKAFGVEGLYREASGSAAGQEIQLQKKKADLYRELGTNLLPLYVRALQKLISVTRSVTAWVREHPALTKGIVVFGAVLGGLMVVMGGLMITVGSFLGQWALIRFAFKAAFMGASVLPKVLSLVSGAFRFVGTVIVWLARLLVANPIVAVVAAIAGAAYLIYRNWDQVKAWLGRLWEDIKQIFHGAYEFIAGLFTGNWQRMVDGFRESMAGVGKFWGDVWQGIRDTVMAGVNWILDKLEPLRSELRNTAQAWHDLMGDGQARPDAPAPTKYYGNPKQFPPGLFNAPKPMGTKAGTPTAATGDVNNWHINAPGGDPVAMRRDINRIMDERDRARQTRGRSSLSDAVA